MNAAERKEIRLLLPAWIAALAASIFPVWLVPRNWGNIEVGEIMFLFFFVAGALLLSLASFGLEMSFGTFASLLAQPRRRQKTWQLKIVLLASALALVMLAGAFSLRLWRYSAATYIFSMWGWDEHEYCFLLLALMAFVGGLWTTLLFRQMLTAFWVAILAPLLLFCAFLVLRDWQGLRISLMESFALVACGYAVAGFLLARWLFLRAQDKPEREATDAIAWSFLPAFRTRRGPVAALLVKELRLQQGTLVFAAVLLLLQLAAMSASKFLPRNVLNRYAYFFWLGFLWLLAPVQVACASVAEERRGRTLESTLCLPVAGPAQFAIKMLVVLGLALFLGAVMPWLLEILRSVVESNDPPINGSGLQPFLIISVVLAGFGCYGSSVSSTFLHSFCAALFLGVVLLFGADLANWAISLLWPVLVLASFCLSYANFKQVRITRLQLLLNGLASVAIVFALQCLGWIFGIYVGDGGR
jgi:hypothetical protein